MERSTTSFSVQEVTLSCWVRRQTQDSVVDTTTKRCYVYAEEKDTNNRTQFALGQRFDEIMLIQESTNRIWTSPYRLEVGEWHHVVFEIKSGRCAVHLNGVNLGEQGATQALSNLGKGHTGRIGFTEDGVYQNFDITQLIFISDKAYEPETFGYKSASGQWVSKSIDQISNSIGNDYGQNGFYLDFDPTTGGSTIKDSISTGNFYYEFTVGPAAAYNSFGLSNTNSGRSSETNPSSNIWWWSNEQGIFRSNNCAISNDTMSKVQTGDIVGVSFNDGEGKGYVNGVHKFDFSNINDIAGNDEVYVAFDRASNDGVGNIVNFGQQPFAASNVTHDWDAGTVVIDGETYGTLFQTWEEWARTALGYALDRITKLEQQREADLATIDALRTDVQAALARITSIESNEIADDAVDTVLLTQVADLITRVEALENP